MSKVHVIGDIHSEGLKLREHVEVLLEHNESAILLGDLVDRGDEPDVMIDQILRLEAAGLLQAIVCGNHDHKLYRYLIGRNVSLGGDGRKTADFFDQNPEYASAFKRLIEASYLMYRQGSNFFVHAAIPSSFFESDSIPYKRYLIARSELDETVQKRGEHCLYGFPVSAGGQLLRDSNGFPIRSDTWIEKIPCGVTVYKGHDYDYDEVIVRYNSAGGRVVYVDTGAGQGGTLSCFPIIE